MKVKFTDIHWVSGLSGHNRTLGWVPTPSGTKAVMFYLEQDDSGLYHQGGTNNYNGGTGFTTPVGFQPTMIREAAWNQLMKMLEICQRMQV